MLIDREICTLYIDAVHFFQILIFSLFSVYYYMMSLSDFRPIFLYAFKLPKQAEKLTRHLTMIVLMNALFDGLRNLIPEILASKMSPEVVDLQ